MTKSMVWSLSALLILAGLSFSSSVVADSALKQGKMRGHMIGGSTIWHRKPSRINYQTHDTSKSFGRFNCRLKFERHRAAKSNSEIYSCVDHDAMRGLSRSARKKFSQARYGEVARNSLNQSGCSGGAIHNTSINGRPATIIRNLFCAGDSGESMAAVFLSYQLNKGAMLFCDDEATSSKYRQDCLSMIHSTSWTAPY